MDRELLRSRWPIVNDPNISGGLLVEIVLTGLDNKWDGRTPGINVSWSYSGEITYLRSTSARMSSDIHLEYHFGIIIGQMRLAV